MRRRPRAGLPLEGRYTRGIPWEEMYTRGIPREEMYTRRIPTRGEMEVVTILVLANVTLCITAFTTSAIKELDQIGLRWFNLLIALTIVTLVGAVKAYRFRSRYITRSILAALHLEDLVRLHLVEPGAEPPSLRVLKHELHRIAHRRDVLAASREFLAANEIDQSIQRSAIAFASLRERYQPEAEPG